ncbi:MAG: MoaD/ThiS family protein [Alphaproteobacteria bacterium]|nr:MoaD/ThiS family protein [Alphaproteobacteria bacterium]MDA7999840.1 MoaD/ThiS family protein [Alphaproteobacteria bacterium]MDA8003363.1 MoaD/ThiS family protein [Alphaproteobacteria bacterium]MDA8005303.1 MoaD/ThiS family protein [Alphaproteobacteria bacterium]MDA8012748.1 MoaD/ThiS family protein [Alphaproteobacteria bacterium]
MSARVTLRLFAWVRERAGYGERVLEVGEGETLGLLLERLAGEEAVWAELMSEADRLRFACNGEICADLGVVLADGDEVAIFPPVTGG